MTKRKKIIVLSCMIALLAVTAVFNFVLTTPTGVNNGETNVITTSNYFTQYRNERLNSRNEELLQLDSVIQNAEANSEEYALALSLKIELTDMTEKEFLLENLI
ncbi:MAG: SpoIIIAH-like family protein, partial [Clostridia bacterium]|nr:SpoIIIAH-like family protein [Clostridia bacterium]